MTKRAFLLGVYFYRLAVPLLIGAIIGLCISGIACRVDICIFWSTFFAANYAVFWATRRLAPDYQEWKAARVGRQLTRQSAEIPANASWLPTPLEEAARRQHNPVSRRNIPSTPDVQIITNRRGQSE